MSYNGWANYETWLVRLEIFDGSTASDWLPRTRSRTYVADLADALRQYAVERVEEDGRGIAASLAEAFLSGVNWREIAQHMADDEAEEEADEADEDDDWEEEEMSEETRAGILEKFGDAP